MDFTTEKFLRKQIFLIAQGDKSALSPVYSLLKQGVFLLIYSIIHDIGNAENIMQDTLVRILEKASMYKGENAKSWIYTIARNNALNFIKKNEREFITEDFSAYTDKYNLENTVAFNDMIDQLDGLEKQVVILRIYSDFKT